MDRSQHENVSNHPYGKEEIVANIIDGHLIVNENRFLDLLLQVDVKNRKIVALSIVGAFRKGKSFLLNYCLRFLYANYTSINYPNNPLSNPKNWIGGKDDPLTGFSFKPGINRDTTGIVFWNDIFLHTNEITGDKIAIVVVDTQGLFDIVTLPADNSRIFALSTLISSIQVLNLAGVIQQDQLQYLQFAIEFSKYAERERKQCSVFQKLIFVLRDWEHWEDFDFGFEGGMKYINSILEIRQNQKKELKTNRHFIRNSFDKLDCFLLPDPGDRVAGRKRYKTNYDGNWGEMDEEFKEELTKLIEHLLKPEKLVVKKFNGNDLNGQDFYQYIKEYFRIFEFDLLPKVHTVYDFLIRKRMEILVNQCIEKYKLDVYANYDRLTCIEENRVLHNVCKDLALMMFDEEAEKTGSIELQEEYMKILDARFEIIFKNEWGNPSKMSDKDLEAEKARAHKAIADKRKLEIDYIENKKEIADKLMEMERQEQIGKFSYEQKLIEYTNEKEFLINDQKCIQLEVLMELEKLRALNIIDQEKFLEEEEFAEKKHQAELERINAEHAEKVKEIEDKRKLIEENFNEVKKVASGRLKIQQMKLEKIVADKEKNKAITKLLDVQKELREWENFCTREKRKQNWSLLQSIKDELLFEDIIQAGYDSDEDPIYVGRALHNGSQFPAKVISSKNKKTCSITFNSSVIEKTRFEVLLGNFEWKATKNGEVPKRARFAGFTNNNEKMFIGRGKHNGNYIVGKILEGTYFLSISYKGTEVKLDEFEFLITE